MSGEAWLVLTTGTTTNAAAAPTVMRKTTTLVLTASELIPIFETVSPFP
jgi:hypothetical protein